MCGHVCRHANGKCSNMLKIARAECKVKVHFQSLLRRSRFSRQSLKNACKLVLSVLRFASAKVECDYATGKPFLNRIFNRTPKQPANPDK